MPFASMEILISICEFVLDESEPGKNDELKETYLYSKL
jgi:hypothetical protein